MSRTLVKEKGCLAMVIGSNPEEWSLNVIERYLAKQVNLEVKNCESENLEYDPIKLN